jgi:hypothetical protein
MTRLIAVFMGVFTGGCIGMLFSMIAAICGAVAMGALALLTSAPTGMTMTRSDRKTMRQAMDMAFVMFWAAGPALKRFLRHQDRYLEHEAFLFEMCMPSDIRDQIAPRDEIIELCRETVRIGTEPHAALRRHNRAFRPHMFRKRSASFTVMNEVARMMLYAGADRRGIIWYFHVAKRLGVKPGDAMGFLSNAVAEQKSEMRMIPGVPPDDSALGRCHEGIETDEKILPYLDWYEQQRAELLDIMFGIDEDTSRAA